MTAYLSMFLIAFGAATLLPGGSEALLVGLLLSDRYLVWLLLLVATVGNVLGSVVNWWLGLYLQRFQDRRWFPVTPQQLARAQVHYHRYGRWSLLLSWAPVVGDPLTLVAGVMREPWWSFLVLVTIAKTGRYLVLAMMTLGWLSLGSGG